MQPIEKEFLAEHFLSGQSFHQALSGEAFILDCSSEFLGVLNVKDHLFLQLIDVHEELEKTWDRLVEIELGLKQAANFAFSPRFGFLCSDPTKCGTAFHVSIFLHLPALICTHSLEEVLAKNQDESIEQTGLQGDPNEMIGDIVVFHNRYSLGLAEDTILASLRPLATKIVAEERSMRHHIKQESETELADVKDKVSRAFAILLHSYQIESIEALNSISLLKLGLDLKWIEGTSQEVLNELLISCRRAHLLCRYGDQVSQEQLPHKRAEYIHQSLHGVKLLI
jgi:protein arginine kinase